MLRSECYRERITDIFIYDRECFYLICINFLFISSDLDVDIREISLIIDTYCYNFKTPREMFALIALT